MRLTTHASGVILALLLVSVAPAQAYAEPPRSVTAETNPIAAVIAKISPAVVRIVTVRPPKPPDDKTGEKLANASASNETSTAIGSGFIIDPAGFVATNKHVIEDAISVFVVTADGVRYPASVVGMPGKADIGLLRIHAGHNLPAIQFGDSDKMRVGDMVIAIGSPFGFDNSVTSGILSAVNRDIMESPFDDYLQTDAAINHGNSGGPLFNMAGEVIGMNSVIFAPGTGSVGLGFAVPSNDLQFVFDRLMKTGEIKAGMLPLHTQQVTWMLQQAFDAPDLQGALVSAVMDDGGVMLHGMINPGDVILTFDGQTVWDPRDLARKAARAPIGSDAALEIFRGGERKTVHVTIHAWPEGQPIVLRYDEHQKLGLDLVSARGESGNPNVTVASVDPNGTAAASGIQKGDIIVEVQQTPVSAPDQALRIFSAPSSISIARWWQYGLFPALPRVTKLVHVHPLMHSSA